MHSHFSNGRSPFEYLLNCIVVSPLSGQIGNQPPLQLPHCISTCLFSEHHWHKRIEDYSGTPSFVLHHANGYRHKSLDTTLFSWVSIKILGLGQQTPCLL